MAETNAPTPPAAPKPPVDATQKAEISEKNAALETIMLRNDFYRENYRRLTAVLITMVALVAGSIGFAFFIYATRPSPQYFATTTEGAIIRLQPLSDPNLSTPVLLTWAAQAATQAFTYNFVNYKEALQENRANFTPRGFQNYMKAINASNNLEAVIAKKLVVSAIPSGVPLIIQEGLAGDRYAWRIQLPLKVTYQSASENIPQDLILTMLVTRVPTLESPKGVGIAQFIFREARG